MLYISSIDNYTFATSGKSSGASDIEAVYPKIYLAFGVTNPDATTHLVTIINKENADEKLVSSRDVREITLGGVVYTTKQAFVAAFNTMVATSSSGGGDVDVSGLATQTTLASVLAAIIALTNKQFPTAIHVLTGTNPAPNGVYTGFYALTADTAISSITLLDNTKVTGTNTFAGVTFQPGVFIPVPGNFSTATLSAGALILAK